MIQAEQEKAAAEVEESRAKTDKAIAEAELTREKIISERVEQIRIGAGIGFDEDAIKIQRAQLMADLKKGEVETKLKKAEAVGRAREGGAYQERGMKSNNKKA